MVFLPANCSPNRARFFHRLLTLRPRSQAMFWLLLKCLLFVAVVLAVWLLLPAIAHAQGPLAPPPPEVARQPRQDSANGPTLLGGPESVIIPAPSADPPTWPYLNLVKELFRRATELSESDQEGELERELYDLALAVAARAGLSDNPKAVLDALSTELFEQRGFKVKAAGPGVPALLTPAVFDKRLGSPRCLALLILTLAESVRPYLEFHYAELAESPDAGVIRFQRKNYTANLLLAPGREGRDWTDETLSERFRLDRQAAPAATLLRGHTLEEFKGLLLYDLGLRLLTAGKKAQAGETLLRSKELCPSSSASLELAKLASEEGDFDAALEFLENAEGVNKKSYTFLELRARVLLQVGEIGRARQELVTLLGRFPAKAMALHESLGDLEMRAGRREPALSHYQQAAKDAPAAARSRIAAHIRTLKLLPEIEVLAGDAPYSRKFGALIRLSKSPTPASIPPLIDSLGDANLRYARFAWKVLQMATGKNLGFSQELWRQWRLEEERARQSDVRRQSSATRFCEQPNS